MWSADLRPVTPADIDWLLDLADEKYPPYNRDAARDWLERFTQPADHYVFLRSEHGATMASAISSFHDPTGIEVHLGFLACLGSAPPMRMEGFRLLQGVIGWARGIGARSFHFGSQTGVDFSSFAKRLGAAREIPSFELRLEAPGEQENHRDHR